MDDPENPKPARACNTCPHCGRQLSQWEQVLLSVDRALMCKSCWYRITLKAYDRDQEEKSPRPAPPEDKPKDKR